MVLERLRTEYAIEELDEKRKSAPPGTEAERQKIADELSAMGEVNFRAEKEYKELKERSEFLETQKADLTQAMDSLRKTISKIDAVSKDLFIETFDQVNEAFKRYTQMLFKGGKGTLSINPDTSGVELYVQPRVNGSRAWNSFQEVRRLLPHLRSCSPSWIPNHHPSR